MRAWVEQIITAADADLQLVRVPEQHLPPDLALLGAPAQHLLAETQRAQQLLVWQPADPSDRVPASVRWHLRHPPRATWTDDDTAADTTALATAARAG